MGWMSVAELYEDVKKNPPPPRDNYENAEMVLKKIAMLPAMKKCEGLFDFEQVIIRKMRVCKEKLEKTRKEEAIAAFERRLCYLALVHKNVTDRARAIMTQERQGMMILQEARIAELETVVQNLRRKIEDAHDPETPGPSTGRRVPAINEHGVIQMDTDEWLPPKKNKKKKKSGKKNKESKESE